MSNQVVPVQNDWTPDQIKLITSVVAKGATSDELKLFLYRCKNLGLDPLKPGQIHFIKYGNSPGTIVVGIEGFRARAHSTGKMAGIQRGVIRDDNGKVTGAYCEVYRTDWKHAAREEVSLAEYSTGKHNWLRMPETMIKKVAEAAALRMAFPDELGGVYAKEEMDQAKPVVVPEQPGSEDGVQTEGSWGYVIPGGQYAKRGVNEIPKDEVTDYITRREAVIAKDPSKKPAWWDDFVFRVEQYWADQENKEPGEDE